MSFLPNEKSQFNTPKAMANTEPIRLPTDDELLAAVNAPDLLTVAIRGHQCVEAALNQLLNAALTAPHEIEIKRVSFAPKVDLAIALGLLRVDSRALFLAVNRIRNQYAHDQQAQFDSNQSADVANAFSSYHRRVTGIDPAVPRAAREALEYAIGITFVEAQSSAERVHNEKVSLAAALARMQKLLGNRITLRPDKVTANENMADNNGDNR
jgi:hypothetical protein